MSDFSFLTPEGRHVSGSLTELNKKDHNGRDLAPEKYNWYFALAFPKTAASWWEESGDLGVTFGKVREAAASHYKGRENQLNPFAWKIENGDDPKHAGKEGFAGCWILKFTRYVGKNNMPPVKVFDTNNQELIGNMIGNKGDYYRVAGSCTPNGVEGLQAGVYMNMNMVQFRRKGVEIISGPSAEQVFGPATGAPTTPGMSPTPPSAPANTPQAPVSAPTPPTAPAATPGVAPAPQFANGGGFAPAPVVEVKRLYQGVAYTEAVLKASNHTDEMIATYPIAQ